MTTDTDDFKAECPHLLARVAKTRQPLIINQNGNAIAKLVPMPSKTELFGALAGSVLHEGDLISPLQFDGHTAA